MRAPSHQKNSQSYTGIIIFANIVVFLLYFILQTIFGSESVLPFIALQPEAILSGKYAWTFLTSMFMHAGFGHLFVNMVSLFFIWNLRRKTSWKKKILMVIFRLWNFSRSFIRCNRSTLWFKPGTLRRRSIRRNLWTRRSSCNPYSTTSSSRVFRNPDANVGSNWILNDWTLGNLTRTGNPYRKHSSSRRTLNRSCIRNILKTKIP